MTGWQWDYVQQEMTLSRLAALERQWNTFPPLPVVLRAYYPLKPKGFVSHKNTQADFDELCGLFGLDPDGGKAEIEIKAIA